MLATKLCINLPKISTFIFTGRNEVVAKVMFLHVSVILLTGGVSGQPPHRENPPGPGRPPHRENPPGTRQTPPPGRESPLRTRQTPPLQTRQTPPAGRTPPQNQADTSPWQGEPPLDQADPQQGEPPWQGKAPPGMENPPPREADDSIRSMSGRYASYWNAYLFK